MEVLNNIALSLYIKYLAPQYRLCRNIEECLSALNQKYKIERYDEEREIGNTIVANLIQKAKKLSETTTMSYQEALGQVYKEFMEEN